MTKETNKPVKAAPSVKAAPCGQKTDKQAAPGQQKGQQRPKGKEKSKQVALLEVMRAASFRKLPSGGH
jgi:hypothetical protein